MTDSARLAGRVALVTGGGRGLGRAVAERFVHEGARVAIADIDGELAREAAAALGEGGLGIQCDVSRADDVEQAFDACLERFGRLDILVNNAAVVGPAVKHFLEVDEPTWDLVLDANLKGHYLCTLRAARHMVEQGAGDIINTSSGGASRAHRGMVAYDAAKGGVEAFTRAVALDLAPYGVRCVCIVPGLMETAQAGPAAEERARATAATVPLGRQGTGADIAGAAVFLASEDASYVTGSCLYVDGGVLVQQRSPEVETFPLERFPRLGRLA
jgi:NAD(P)-dependent dehydrogenase (short-subunit alcohol dehydrogenase family)